MFADELKKTEWAERRVRREDGDTYEILRKLSKAPKDGEAKKPKPSPQRRKVAAAQSQKRYRDRVVSEAHRAQMVLKIENLVAGQEWEALMGVIQLPLCYLDFVSKVINDGKWKGKFDPAGYIRKTAETAYFLSASKELPREDRLPPPEPEWNRILAHVGHAVSKEQRRRARVRTPGPAVVVISDGVPMSPGALKLMSWKEIARHLDVNVRTAQKWECEHGLPVSRASGPRGRVCAVTDRLDVWKRQRTLDAAGPPTKPTDRGDEVTLLKSLEFGPGFTLMRRLMEDGALTEQELSQYLANDGKITPEGKLRISRAITEKVFRDAGQFDSASEELRNKVECIVEDLVTSDPVWNLIPKVRAAIDLIAGYDSVKWDSFDQYRQQQQGLLSEAMTDPQVDVIAKCLLRFSPMDLTKAFRQYAQAESQIRLLAQSSSVAASPVEVFKASDRAFREAFGPAIEAPSEMFGSFESNSRRTLNPEHEPQGAMDLNLRYNVKLVPYLCPGSVSDLKPPIGASDAAVEFSAEAEEAKAYGNPIGELLTYKYMDKHGGFDEEHPRAGLPVAPVLEDVAKEVGLDDIEKQVLASQYLGISRVRAMAAQRTSEKKLAVQAAWRQVDRKHKTQIREALEQRQRDSRDVNSQPTQPAPSAAPSEAFSSPPAILQRLADKRRAAQAVTLSKKERVAEEPVTYSLLSLKAQADAAAARLLAARGDREVPGHFEIFLNNSSRWVRDRQK